MAFINQFKGMLTDIFLERQQLTLAESTTAITSGTASTRILIYAYNGPFMPKGSTMLAKPRFSTESITLKLSTDLDSGDTAINFDSFTPTFDLPAKTGLFFNSANALSFENKRFFVEHIHMFETGQTHGNDQLINSQEPGGGKYNHNSGAILTSGSSYSNNWGSKFSVLNIPSYKCRLERVIYSCSSDGTTNEDWTISLWKKPINANSATASNITLINAEDIICQNNASYVHYIEAELNEDLDAGMAIIPSFKKSGSKQTSSTKHFADITLIFSYYDA
jgi:hypothetical protein